MVETGKAGHQGLVSIRVRNRTKDGPLDSARVLEPFYSTKSGGTGLGLAIVNGIVEALHGRFSIEQDETGEVTAQLVLPTSAGAAGESSVAARSGGSERSPRRFNDSSRWCT